MSEALDNVGVMMLLHQKMMRDAEVATAYQLMLANPKEEEPPIRRKGRKGSTTGGLDPCSTHS